MARLGLLPLFLLGTLCGAQAATLPARRELPPGRLLGVSYAMRNRANGGYASEASRRTLEHLRSLGVNSVSVMPFAFLRTPDSTDLVFRHRDPRAETDEAMACVVADAQVLGLTVLYKPQIWLGGDRFTGEVAPRTEAAARRWFEAYREFLVHHATLAESSGASIFCVGTELSGTERWEREWRRTIAAVRRVTGKPLVYACNWASGASRVPFWDALDAIGVNFYDPIAASDVASEEELVAGVRRLLSPLGALSARAGKPIIITELGYASVACPWKAPHDENTGRPVRPGDAARCAEAFFRVVSGERWIRGFYWWKVFSSGEPAEPDRPSFNILGQPIERVITVWYRKLGASP